MSKELLVNGKPIRYDLVPVDYMSEGLRLYFERGIMPGDFMSALLRNDLMGACGRADAMNSRHIYEWAVWLYNHAPGGSYGSDANVKAWVKMVNEKRKHREQFDVI